jgi:transposase
MFIRSPDLARQKEKKKENRILCKTERKEEELNKRRKRERNLKCMSSSTAYSYVWYLFTEVSGNCHSLVAYATGTSTKYYTFIRDSSVSID